MENPIYLDNSSTTKPCEKACVYIDKALRENWGNPSSLHSLGIDAELLVTRARQAVAKSIYAQEEEIIFTGSGTEANNTAVMSVARSRKHKVITSVLEHPSVLEPVKRLEEQGFEVVRIGCNSGGVIDLEELEKNLDNNTALVSVMFVNNEVGSIQPIESIVKTVKRVSPSTLVHCDAVQGFGKEEINVKKLGVDLLTVSAHKVHGPKGVGALYCKKGVKIPCFINGGGQERGLRSGTEPVPLIAGFLGAVEELPNIKMQYEKMRELNAFARERFLASGFIEINSPKDASPYILNISVLGFRSETLLHYLESKNIFVSSGSACAKGETSYVLSALGLDRKHSDSALRISFSRYNTKEDVEMLLSALSGAVNTLRRSKI